MFPISYCMCGFLGIEKCEPTQQVQYSKSAKGHKEVRLESAF